jgi:uncharacterized protein YabE (DUF348 family)
MVLVGFFFFAGGLVVANGQTVGPSDSHVVSLYVDGQESAAPTRAATVGDFIKKANIVLNEGDLVEPATKTTIDADNFRINVYHAKPVTITDGSVTKKVMTPHKSPQTIAQKAGFTVYPEDNFNFTTTSTFVKDNILGATLNIDRATPVTISLYGAPAAVYRTHSNTVGELLKERGIVPEKGSTVTPSENSQLSPNMAVFVSKYGKTVVYSEEPVAFDIDSTNDPSLPMGKINIITPGVMGKKQIVFEVETKDGKEVKRRVLQEVVIVQPQKQIQTRGSKPGYGLSKSRGAYFFTDSKGIIHRETYYDLPMRVVMNSCGAGGNYSVREDGAKVDKDGYILIAANYNNYPKCSIVETSMGLGRVYDTGGFAFVHPHGFDLATDWTNNDGR